MSPSQPHRNRQTEKGQRDRVEQGDGGGERQQREGDHYQGEGKRIRIAASDEEAEPFTPGQVGERDRVVRGLALQDQFAGQPVVVEVVRTEAEDEGPECPPGERYGDGHDRQDGDLPAAEGANHGPVARLIEDRHRNPLPRVCTHPATIGRMGPGGGNEAS